MAHKFLTERKLKGVWMVLRLDDYTKEAGGSRGQFYTEFPRQDDSNKALWPTEKQAMDAAAWAADKFGHLYGVFKCVAFAEQAKRPVKTTRVRA